MKYVIVIFLFTQALFAQNPPASEIYLLKFGGDGKSIAGVENISNHPGYDNQPAFLTDDTGLLWAAAADSAQTDVFLYRIGGKEKVQLTTTRESEYSPTPLHTRSLHFSTVRVERDGRQRLWEFNMVKKSWRLLLPEIEPVGYHAWIDADRLVLFVLGEPHHKLVLVNRKKGTRVQVAEQIGRCLQKIPGKNSVSFVQKNNGEDWQIMQVDPKTFKVQPVCPALPGSEDYLWFDKNTLLMAQDSKIFLCNIETDAAWHVFLDLQKYPVSGISRMALSRNKQYLAFVASAKDVKKK